MLLTASDRVALRHAETLLHRACKNAENDLKKFAEGEYHRSHREEIQGEIDRHQAGIDVIEKLLAYAASAASISKDPAEGVFDHGEPHCHYCDTKIAGIPAAHKGGPCPSCGKNNSKWLWKEDD